MNPDEDVNLDDLYGVPREPNGLGRLQAVDSHERDSVPLSMIKLDADSAETLKTFMGLCDADWRGAHAVINDINIIWVVDVGGDIWFAVEELFDPKLWEDNKIFRARYRSLEETKGLRKLGHPALVGDQDKMARIGGEIYFEPRETPALWIINNRSGRYGSGDGREEKHLSAVCEAFNGYGIDLDMDFSG